MTSLSLYLVKNIGHQKNNNYLLPSLYYKNNISINVSDHNRLMAYIFLLQKILE